MVVRPMNVYLDISSSDATFWDTIGEKVLNGCFTRTRWIGRRLSV